MLILCDLRVLGCLMTMSARSVSGPCHFPRPGANRSDTGCGYAAGSLALLMCLTSACGTTNQAGSVEPGRRGPRPALQAAPSTSAAGPPPPRHSARAPRRARETAPPEGKSLDETSSWRPFQVSGGTKERVGPDAEP